VISFSYTSFGHCPAFQEGSDVPDPINPESSYEVAIADELPHAIVGEFQSSESKEEMPVASCGPLRLPHPLIVIGTDNKEEDSDEDSVITEAEKLTINQMVDQGIPLRLAVICCKLWDVSLTERDEADILNWLEEGFSLSAAVRKVFNINKI